MVYPFMTLNDGTEIAHTEAVMNGNNEQVKVYIEKAVEGGFNSAECILPEYEWSNIQGFSEKEMSYLKEFIESTAHVIIRLARCGGFENASGF